MTEAPIPIDLRLHLPASARMVAVVHLITDLADRLGGRWEYRQPLTQKTGRFDLHDLHLPETQP